MKKLALILAVVLAASMFLAACGTTPQTQPPAANSPSSTAPSANPGDPVTPPPPAADISGDLVLAWWGNPTRNAHTEGVVDLFEAEFPGVMIEMHNQGWTDYWPWLGTMAAGGDLPDVIQQDWAYLEEYVSNNQLLDLTPYINSGAIDLSNVPDSVINTGRIGGGIYAVSLGMNGPSMLYNKSLTDELGITIEDNMTIDQFVEVSKRIYAEKGIRTNVVYGDPSNPLEIFLRARGIVMLTPQGMGGTAEDYVEFFEFLENGIKDGWHILPSHMVGRQGVEQDPLISGSDANQRSWVGFNFSNQMHSFMEAAAPEGIELAMTTYPSSNPSQSNYIRSSMYFSVSANSKNPDAAAALINFWTNSIDANNIILAERGIPASTVVADAIAPNMTPANVMAAAFVEKVAGNSTAVNPPRPAAAAEIIQQLRDLTEAVGNGTMTGQAAAAEFFNFGNEALARG